MRRHYSAHAQKVDNLAYDASCECFTAPAPGSWFYGQFYVYNRLLALGACAGGLPYLVDME